MPELVTISNTSPLLYLHLVGQLTLLPQLYGQIVIPLAVQAELQAGAARGVNVPVPEEYSWLRVQSLTTSALLPLVTDLGRGEAEVIALGLGHAHSRLILDDTLARRIARLNQLRYTGTVGVLLKARECGLLDTVSPVLAALREAGLWLSDTLITAVLNQAGEM